jgi:hypothetical protein
MWKIPALSGEGDAYGQSQRFVRSLVGKVRNGQRM